tara:strand:- start:182 stop:643 length:462 start_codon:yes stop_codon:yes gene_type:complete
MENLTLKNKTNAINFNWKCVKTWQKSIKNTLWCLLGCSIGDFGTILFFQLNNFGWPTLHVMILAIINGLITSIILETFILSNQMQFKKAFYTSINMSFLSMIAMEVSMNLVDWLIIGSAKLVWWIIPIMLFVGFIVPLPYNYWRLKKHNLSCH